MCCAALQVNVDNIDRDLFGRSVRGAMYQPADRTFDKLKISAHKILHQAYAENVVRPLEKVVVDVCFAFGESLCHCSCPGYSKDAQRQGLKAFGL